MLLSLVPSPYFHSDFCLEGEIGPCDIGGSIPSTSAAQNGVAAIRLQNHSRDNNCLCSRSAQHRCNGTFSLEVNAYERTQLQRRQWRTGMVDFGSTATSKSGGQTDEHIHPKKT